MEPVGVAVVVVVGCAVPSDVTLDSCTLAPVTPSIRRPAGAASELEPAACVTAKLRLPMVMNPLRENVVGFAATVYETVPLPEPVDVVVTQLTELTAVQVHPVVEVTVMVPLPPVTGKFWLVGVIVKLQDIPGCVTVKIRPATVMVPLRKVAPVLAAAV